MFAIGLFGVANLRRCEAPGDFDDLLSTLAGDAPLSIAVFVGVLGMMTFPIKSSIFQVNMGSSPFLVSLRPQ